MKKTPLKIIMLSVLLTLGACMSIPEESSWPPTETELIKENKSSNKNYSSSKGLKTPLEPNTVTNQILLLSVW